MRVVYVPGTFNLCIINYGTCNWRIITGDVFTAHTFRNTSHRENQGPPRRAALNTKLTKDFSLGSRATKTRFRSDHIARGNKCKHHTCQSLHSPVHQYNCPMHQIFNFKQSMPSMPSANLSNCSANRCCSFSKVSNDLASTLDHNRICGGGFPGVTGAGKHSRRASDYLQAPWYAYIYI